MLQFHFKKSLPEVLSLALLRAFPGIDKIWLISEEPDSESFKLQESNQQNPTPQLVQKVEIKKSNFLNTKHFYRWISLDETPLSDDKDTRRQFNIFDEYKNRILHLYIPERENGFMLFYIFFSNEQAVSGPHADNRLSTENKQLVAHTIYHMLLHEIERHQSDNKVAAGIQKMQSRMAKHQGNRHLQDFVKSYIADYLSSVQHDYGISIKISDDALNYLTDQPVKPDEVKQLLNEAISWGINFSDIASNGEFTIEASHVVTISNYTDKESFVNDKIHDSKFSRTYELLEKLEKAAQKVVQNNQKLTGHNVGQAFEHAITAPAITDALKKHAKKAQMLIKLYPGRWPIIRKQFKPLLNVLEEADFESYESLSGT